MSIAGYSTLEVIPSVKGLRSSLEKQTAGDMAAAGRTGGGKFGDEAGRAGATSFKSRFSGALKGYTPFAGLAIGAGVTALFKSAIDEASSLAESANKINVVFGEAAGQVNDFADAASEGLGQSDLQARNAAASFGVYGKAANLAGSDLGDFATNLTALSSDLASFFDTDVQTAIDAIGSGLRGEAEPLRQFGVLLDDATLRTEAFKQGLIQSTENALTPQQKVLAAYSSIMKQTKDAQGDFGRTADGLANSSRDLTADLADMRAELGEELLPATLAFVSFLKDDALPALETTGGVVKDAAQAFGALPAPVKAAAGAFLALKAASAVGLTGSIATGATGAKTALAGLSTRLDLYRIGVDDARTKTVQFAGTSAKVETGVGRMSAAMNGLRASTLGTGAAMKRGLGSLVGFFGGPWGVAITGATAGLTLWWQQHEKAQAAVAASDARVKAFTATLDENTGALTANSRRFAAEELIGEDTLRQFEELGFRTADVVTAVTEGGAALDRLQSALSDLGAQEAPGGITDMLPEGSREAAELADALNRAAGEAESGKEEFDLFAGAVQKGVVSTDRITAALEGYRSQIDDTKKALTELIAAEEERAANAIQSRRDNIGLISTLSEVEKEARKGKQTLDTQTKAGQDNMLALLDLADQWTNSTTEVQNARGAYQEMRQNFIDVAKEMGATQERARKLADELLKVPENAKTKFQSEGYQELMAQLQALREQKRLLNQGGIVLQLGRNNIDGNPTFASGGLIGGRGTGTSDDNLIWASRGEFMQRKAAVDYYGIEFMRKLNALQLPRFKGYAQGGLIQPTPQPAATVAGLTVGHMTVVAQDWRDFVRKGQRKAMSAQSDGVRWE